MNAVFQSRALRTILVVCGAHVFLRVLTGQGLVARARRLFSARRDSHASLVPSIPLTDPIDEASWESFPASDPPATGQFGTPPLPH